MGFPHGINHSCQGSEVRGQLLIEGGCILPALTPPIVKHWGVGISLEQPSMPLASRAPP